MTRKKAPPWDRFVDMMRRDGWVKYGFNNGNGEAAFYNGAYIYWPDGEMVRNGRSAGNCGDWRKWLAAGETPPPF